MKEHKIFKPFEKVLVRDDYGKWYCALYSHCREKNEHEELCHYTTATAGYKDEDILTYEGNEHLVGTTDDPEEEIILKVGEFIIASDNIYALRIGLGSIGEFRGIKDDRFLKSGFERFGVPYEYIIRFKDFDPSNMEETRKHILEIRNGKIRYKKTE